MTGLRIFWYWPFAHLQESALARSVLRDGDHLTLQCQRTVDGENVRNDGAAYEVRRELPESTLPAPGVRRKPSTQLLYPIMRSRLRRRCLAHEDFDICHLHSLNYRTGWFDLRGLDSGRALVSTVHDVRPHRHPLPEWAEKRLLRELYRRAGHLLVLHEVLREELVAEYSVDPARVSVLPHPLGLRFASGEATSGRGGGPPRVLFFGGMLRPNKGVPVLLDALDRLDGLDAEFYVTGDGDPELVASLESARSRNVTVELGFVPERRKEELFRSADVVVMPYTEVHSQSGILADAYSFGVPLIVTNVGAIGPTVREDASGWVIEPGDPDSLAEAIQHAVSDNDARELAKRNVRDAAVRYSFPIVGAQLRRLYDELVAASSSSSRV